MIIAGPCSAESREQVLKTASELAARGVKIFRAGIWKPRTKPGGFEGIGVEGLPWMKQVKQETGMLVATEVATSRSCFQLAEAGIDILWVGARTVTNPFAMQELADALKGVDIPILVKNPRQSRTVELVVARSNGSTRRTPTAGRHPSGIQLLREKIYRNAPLWHIPIELRRRYPNLTIFCDPSHIGGKRELVAPISQQALDLNFDGLIIESHCDPDSALSDAAQQVTPEVLDYTLQLLVVRDNAQTTENISILRRQIDEVDEQLLSLLAKRMHISQEIGTYKKEHNMPILQNKRYDEILDKTRQNGAIARPRPGIHFGNHESDPRRVGKGPDGNNEITTFPISEDSTEFIRIMPCEENEEAIQCFRQTGTEVADDLCRAKKRRMK